jgi:hypothetical protein
MKFIGEAAPHSWLKKFYWYKQLLIFEWLRLSEEKGDYPGFPRCGSQYAEFRISEATAGA